MVTCLLQGGIGNQLFMLSQLLSHSLKYDLPYCAPLEIHNPHYVGQKPYIFPGIKYCDKPLNLPIYEEKEFTYQEIPFVDNVCFKGYFQSWKYFKDYETEVLKAFGFKWEMKRGYVSLHVRLGDYQNLQKFHPVISKEYISKAIHHYQERGYSRFLIFSDGIDWCYENINQSAFPGCVFEYSEGRTEIEDLVLGSCCEKNIGSNSTFSLWQHILNQNPEKDCVLPKNWFGEKLPHDTSDIYPLTATIL